MTPPAKSKFLSEVTGLLVLWLCEAAADSPGFRMERTSPTTAQAVWSGDGYTLQSSRDFLEWKDEKSSSPFLFSLEPRRPRIIPVMRHVTTGGSEALGLWYSTDGYHYAELYPGDLYTGTPGNNVRDPSLLIRPDAWFVAYTAGTFGLTTHWGLAKSTDSGKTWMHVMDVPVPDSTNYTWGPSFFREADGQVCVIISISTGNGNHLAYVQKALNESLTAWDGGQPMTGALHPSVDNWVFDIRSMLADGWYYTIARSGPQPKIFRAPALIGPYTLFSIPGVQWENDPDQALEQCQLTHLGGSHWQANFTIPAEFQLCVSESFDGLLTWTPRVQTVSYPGQTQNHQFSEWVLLSPAQEAQIPPPSAYTPSAARRFFRLIR